MGDASERVGTTSSSPASSSSSRRDAWRAVALSKQLSADDSYLQLVVQCASENPSAQKLIDKDITRHGVIGPVSEAALRHVLLAYAL